VECTGHTWRSRTVEGVRSWLLVVSWSIQRTLSGYGPAGAGRAQIPKLCGRVMGTELAGRRDRTKCRDSLCENSLDVPPLEAATIQRKPPPHRSHVQAMLMADDEANGVSETKSWSRRSWKDEGGGQGINDGLERALILVSCSAD
jgi:hypothetical protein